MNCNLTPLLWLKYRSKNDGFRLSAMTDKSIYLLTDDRRIVESNIAESTEGMPTGLRIHKLSEPMRNVCGIWANRSCIYVLCGFLMRRWKVVR